MSSIAFETVKRQTEEKQKGIISVIFFEFFFFQIFQTFENIETDVGINIRIFFFFFDKLSLFSELRYFFVKILIPYKIDLKHAATLPSDQGYLLTCIYGCMKF